ncbi:MAG: hypothetical protein ACFNP4_09435 [Capnocytophaga gingivalis]|uniref:hypothetical protein n=1 Tax=Capnocytophaga gingivalis TaxID=1017 RepID=UPI00361D9F77
MKEDNISPEKVNEVVVVHKSHNVREIFIKNPSEKLLAFVEKIAERSKKHKEELMNKVYKEEDYITI